MKQIFIITGVSLSLLFATGCAINIHNAQNTQGGATASQDDQNSTATARTDAHASANAKAKAKSAGTTKTSVTVRQHTETKFKTKIKLSKKASVGVSTANKFKKGRIKLKAGGKLKGKSSAKGKVKITIKERAKTRGTGKTKISVKTKNKGKGTAEKDKTTSGKDKENKKDTEDAEPTEPEVVEPEVVEYQEPPDEPSENDFGYEEPIYGCFEGEVMFIEPNSPKLPADYSKYDVVSVLYACEWDIPARSFDTGFPGVENQFEWFAIRYSGAFGIETAGSYTFRINSDDGAKLYIDGKLVVDNDGTHAPQSKSGSVDLAAGDHEMVLEYFQGPRYYIALQLFVTPPNGEEGIFSVR
ncbi:MAG: hypothetical protein JXX29_19220 [Deltaproteobacteria bacterium]|nr:hypothetical protein [Deltaproteobacteria bacterium]MBN2673819.1 hypothetical protein [Deltaproteobacteria bacterium]